MEILLGLSIGVISSIVGGIVLQRFTLEDVISKLEREKQRKLYRAEMRHELAKQKIEHKAQQKQLQMKINQDLRDYDYFSNELEKFKLDMISSFTAAQPGKVLLIHSHASGLLEQMWDETDIDEKNILRVKFLDFFDAVTDDFRKLDASQDGTYLQPEKTLNLIRDI